MRSKLTFVFTFITILSLLLMPTKAAAQDDDVFPSGIPYSEIGTKIEAYVNEHKATTAGLAVVVYDSDRIIYQQSFGFEDIAAQRPVTADSVFEWGSISKLVVWVSVMQLWERDQIDLWEDIRTYLPDGFLRKLKYDKPITMINLMNHDAGFQETLVNMFSEDLSSVSTLEDAIKQSEPPQIYRPGQYTAYSNWGAALAAFIVENISGKPFDRYVQENVFAPLGMKTTAIRPDLSDNPEVQQRTKTMRCYDTAANPLPACKFSIPLYPAGMITGTLSDLATFAQSLDPNGQAGKLIFKNPDTFNKLFTETNYFLSTAYVRNSHGMLIYYYGMPAYGHKGNTAGQSAILVMNPAASVGMVVMTNQASEHIYVDGLPELVFGKYEPETELMLPAGVYQSTRTILEGPLSIYRLAGLLTMERADNNRFWDAWQRDGKEILSFPAVDYVKLDTLQLAVYGVFLLLITVSLMGGLATLISVLLRTFRKRSPEVVAKERAQKPLLRWRIWAWVYLLLMVVLVAALAMCALSYQPRVYFYIMIAGFILLFLMMAWHLVRLVGQARLIRDNVSEKRLTAWAALLLVLAMGYIVYWQLYQFWRL